MKSKNMILLISILKNFGKIVYFRIIDSTCLQIHVHNFLHESHTHLLYANLCKLDNLLHRTHLLTPILDEKQLILFILHKNDYPHIPRFSSMHLSSFRLKKYFSLSLM